VLLNHLGSRLRAKTPITCQPILPIWITLTKLQIREQP
jgi:hypothetical protein